MAARVTAGKLNRPDTNEALNKLRNRHRSANSSHRRLGRPNEASFVAGNTPATGHCGRVKQGCFLAAGASSTNKVDVRKTTFNARNAHTYIIRSRDFDSLSNFRMMCFHPSDVAVGESAFAATTI